MGYTGQCACGAITLRISGEALGTAQCWCRQCQTAAAGGPSTNAIFLIEAVQIEGTPRTFNATAASGNTVARHFCTRCGTHLYGLNSSVPELMAVSFGVIDQPHDLAPEKLIWTQEAPAWAVLDHSLEHMAQQTPASQNQD